MNVTYRGNLDIAKLLLQYGADVNAKKPERRNMNKKQGPQKLNSLKSLKFQPPLSKNMGSCKTTIRNGFLIKF